jgi:CrcB protein
VAIAKPAENWSKVAALEAIGMNPGILLAVGLGGALGSLLRYFVAGAIASPATAGFPWGIFTVNVTGGFLMGVIVELGALKLNLTPEIRAFLTVGILGGYTTFSTFSLDSVLLLQRGAYAAAALYITGSTLLSIGALFAGLFLVRAL